MPAQLLRKEQQCEAIINLATYFTKALEQNTVKTSNASSDSVNNSIVD